MSNQTIRDFKNPPVFNAAFGSVNSVSKTYNSLRNMEKEYLGGRNTVAGYLSVLDITSTTRAFMPMPFLARKRFIKLQDIWNCICSSGLFTKNWSFSAISIGFFTFPTAEYLYRPSMHATVNNAANKLNFNPYSLIRQLIRFNSACFQGIKDNKFNITATGPFKLQIYTSEWQPFEQYINDKYSPRETFLIEQQERTLEFLGSYLNKDYKDTLSYYNNDLTTSTIKTILEYRNKCDELDQMIKDGIIGPNKDNLTNALTIFSNIIISTYNKIITDFLPKVNQSISDIYLEQEDYNKYPEKGINILPKDFIFVSTPSDALPVSSMEPVVRKILVSKEEDIPAVPERQEVYFEDEEQSNPDYISPEETPEIPETIIVQVEKIRTIPGTPLIPGKKTYSYHPCTRISSSTPIVYDKQKINWLNSEDRPYMFFYYGGCVSNIDVDKYKLDTINGTPRTIKENLKREVILPGATFLSIGLNDFGINNPINLEKLTGDTDASWYNAYECLERLTPSPTKHYDIILNNSLDHNTSKEIKDFMEFKFSFIDSLNIFVKLLP